MLSAGDLALAALVMAVGACVQGSIGFGMNLIAAPVLLLIDRALVPGPALVAGLALTLLLTYRERRHVDVAATGWATIGRLPGTAAGVGALVVLPENQLTVMFALLVLLAVVLSLGWHVDPTPRTLVPAGALSAFMGTTTAIGGPPMALLYQWQPGKAIRGTLSGFFLTGTILSLAMLAAFGQFGTDQVVASAVLLPGLLVGFGVSHWGRSVLDAGWIRPAVLVLASFAAVIALTQVAI